MDQLAILGGTPARREPYLAWPVFDERDVTAVTEVIRTGQWGGHPYPGPRTAEFTRWFSELQGGGFPVAMMNGTVTMEVALRAAGIGWGDEVIVPSYTFQATAAAPLAAGAIPVIADIDPETYCLSPSAVEAAITPHTRAIIAVHLGAQMADMDALLEIARRHQLVLIEDCAHAHGARWRGQGAGTLGDFGSFSLQSSKILTAGEGGILLCKTPEMAYRAESIIDCGRPHDPAGVIFTMGANYRMTELQAALGIIAIERFPDQARQRAEMADYLEECLSEIPGVHLLRRDPRHTSRSLYRYIFTVQPEIMGLGHAVVCEALEAEGIPCAIGYPAMHHYDLFQPGLSRLPVPAAFPERFDFARMSFPVAENAGEHEAVWLDECVFRAGQKGVDDLVYALRKIQSQAGDLRSALEWENMAG